MLQCFGRKRFELLSTHQKRAFLFENLVFQIRLISWFLFLYKSLFSQPVVTLTAISLKKQHISIYQSLCQIQSILILCHEAREDRYSFPGKLHHPFALDQPPIKVFKTRTKYYWCAWRDLEEINFLHSILIMKKVWSIQSMLIKTVYKAHDSLWKYTIIEPAFSFLIT